MMEHHPWLVLDQVLPHLFNKKNQGQCSHIATDMH